MCGVLGAIGVAAIHIGLQVQPVANISSVADAIKLARQQRVRTPVCHTQVPFVIIFIHIIIKCSSRVLCLMNSSVGRIAVPPQKCWK